MTREDAIQIVQKLLKTNRLDGTGLSQVWDFLKQPVTLAEFLGWEEGQEYEWRGDKFRVQSDILQVWDKDDERWYDSTEELNDYLRLRQAKKVKPRLKAWYVRDEYSFKCLMKELKIEADDVYFGISFGEDRIYFIDENNYIDMDDLSDLDRYEAIEYHKEEPRYLLQTDLTSENGVQYLSFDKKRRKYFIGALMTSENVQQSFTDDEITKIKTITRFAKLCKRIEVE